MIFNLVLIFLLDYHIVFAHVFCIVHHTFSNQVDGEKNGREIISGCASPQYVCVCDDKFAQYFYTNKAIIFDINTKRFVFFLHIYLNASIEGYASLDMLCARDKKKK